MINVAFYVKKEKWQKMNMPHLVEYAKQFNIQIKQIDLSKNLDEQGPFNIIIHKSIDLFVQDQYFHSLEAKNQINNFQSYINHHPETHVINPLKFDQLVISRKETFRELSLIDFKEYCQIPLITSNTQKVLLKPDLACGAPSAHVFEVRNYNDVIESDWYVQPYIESGNAVVKVYSIGDVVRCNIKNPDHIDFHIENDIIYKIAELIRLRFKCELFGFDLIQDIDSKQWYIVDLNSFSGMEVIPGFENLFINFIKNKSSHENM